MYFSSHHDEHSFSLILVLCTNVCRVCACVSEQIWEQKSDLFLIAMKAWLRTTFFSLLAIAHSETSSIFESHEMEMNFPSRDISITDFVLAFKSLSSYTHLWDDDDGFLFSLASLLISESIFVVFISKEDGINKKKCVCKSSQN
jgi:hypothetical protein